MTAITIRKLTDKVAQNLKLRAKANGRSAEAEARLALERIYGDPSGSAWDAVQAFKAKIGGGIDLPNIPRSKDPIEPLDIE